MAAKRAGGERTNRGGGRRSNSALRVPLALSNDDPVMQQVGRALFAAAAACQAGGERALSYRLVASALANVLFHASTQRKSARDLRSLVRFGRSRMGSGAPVASKNALKRSLDATMDEIFAGPNGPSGFFVNVDEAIVEGALPSLRPMFLAGAPLAERVASALVVALGDNDLDDEALLDDVAVVHAKVRAAVLDKWGDGYPASKRPSVNSRWTTGIVNSVLRSLGFATSGFR